MERKLILSQIFDAIRGDPDSDDTDMGISVTEIEAMPDNELADLLRGINDFGNHIDSL